MLAPSGPRGPAPLSAGRVAANSLVRIGLWRSLVARLVRDEEVAGSSPASPTTTTTLGGSSVGRALGCYPRGRGFEAHPPSNMRVREDAVNGQWDLPSGGQQFCPVAASSSARWRPAVLPAGGQVFCPPFSWSVASPPFRRWLG